MLMSFEKVSELIGMGKVLHIAATQSLLEQLPKGNWIGGSTEYFMDAQGGKVFGDALFVTEFAYENFSIKTYSATEIENVATDTPDNGFSIVIVPFDSAVHKEYAENSAGYADMFIKKVVGWVSGVNLGIAGQIPITANGLVAQTYSDAAVALHLELPADQYADINIINIFTPSDTSPVFEFPTEGFSVQKCLADGKEVVLADYIAETGMDTKLPLIGDYSGHGINISIKSIEDGVVNLYAPVFNGIKYRVASAMPNYVQAFHSQLDAHNADKVVFSCNCILNFLYGELEGQKTGGFVGPITFGEIAYQLVNQTLVYVTAE